MTVPSPVPLNAWLGRCDRDGRNQIRRSISNLMLFLRFTKGLGEALRYNEFTHRVEWNGKPLVDTDIIDIRVMIEQVGDTFSPDRGDIWLAVERHARENAFHPVRDYLSALEWDGKSRVGTWLHDYLSASSAPIVGTFGSKFLIGAVARIFSPGCQMDTMLVLEGKQGGGKTTACRALFTEEYLNSNIQEFRTRDASIALEGRWGIEVAELAALRKTDHNSVKKFLSETVDRYRPVNGKKVVDVPRQCVFVGTTNDEHYLQDSTGNRRYWPVACGKIDTIRLQRDRDQLWAEAVRLYEAGEPWWLTAPEDIREAERLQADRVEVEPWGELINLWLNQPENRSREFVRATEVLVGCLLMDRDRINRGNEMRVTDHLKKIGWKADQRVIERGSKPVRVWLRPSSSQPSPPSQPG